MLLGRLVDPVHASYIGLLGFRASDQILLPCVEAAIIAERGRPAVLRSEGFGSERTHFREVADCGLSFKKKKLGLS